MRVVRPAPLARAVLCAIVASCTGLPEGPGRPEAPAFDAVTLTWLSVTGWLLEAGGTSVVLDGYVGRVDRTTVNADGTSTSPARPDEALVRRVGDALLPGGGPDWVLVGHAHWDHSLDAPAWARRRGGRLVGSPTVCLQAEALGLPPERCTAVRGGEAIALGPGLRVRAIRWHHSGDSTTLAGRRLRAPLALAGVPDAARGGLRPGFLEDSPGGGVIAYLFTAETRAGPVTLLWSNTGNPQLWEVPAPADSAYFRAQGIPTDGLLWAPADVSTRASIVAAREAEGIEAVDAWLGFGDVAHVRQVAEALPPRVFVPHHWDDLWAPITDGVARPFGGGALRELLAAEGIDLVVPAQLFERLEVTAAGVRAIESGGAREALGVPAPPGS
jgi:L-ascorbate metabolism protein UlaG (beta-lactamase superfamily)